jgi:predicted RNA-binding Zn ribbon-like protein
MSKVEGLHLVGGSICLDFANTVNARSSGAPRDNLTAYGDLLIWSRRAGALAAGEERSLLARSAAEPEAAQRALEGARKLREAIHQLFIAVARGDMAPDMEAFNVFFGRAMRAARLVRRREGFEIAFDPGGSLDGMLGPVAWSAAELLRGGELDRVKSCAKDTCGWLFMDRSKNRSRRWCEMSDCGNDEKARRFQEKKKARMRER